MKLMHNLSTQGSTVNHHEKLNGSGYPDGLTDKEITVEIRIVCVADIFDALNSDRPYRDRMPIEKVKEILRKDVDSSCLDEKVVGVLFQLIDEGEIEKLYK